MKLGLSTGLSQQNRPGAPGAGGGSIEFISGSVVGANNQNNRQTTRPAGSDSGDFLVMAVGSNLANYPAPSGWTALSLSNSDIGTDSRSLFWRVADGSGLDTPVISFAGPWYGGAAIMAFSGASTPTGTPPTPVIETPSTDPVTAPTIADGSSDVFAVNIRRLGGPANNAELLYGSDVDFLDVSLLAGNGATFTFVGSADSVTHTFSVS